MLSEFGADVQKGKVVEWFHNANPYSYLFLQTISRSEKTKNNCQRQICESHNKASTSLGQHILQYSWNLIRAFDCFHCCKAWLVQNLTLDAGSYQGGHYRLIIRVNDSLFTLLQVCQQRFTVWSEIPSSFFYSISVPLTLNSNLSSCTCWVVDKGFNCRLKVESN